MVGGAPEGPYQSSYKLAPISYRIVVMCEHVFDELDLAILMGANIPVSS